MTLAPDSDPIISIGVPEAEEALLGALRDERASVRKAAVLALAELEV